MMYDVWCMVYYKWYAMDHGLWTIYDGWCNMDDNIDDDDVDDADADEDADDDDDGGDNNGELIWWTTMIGDDDDDDNEDDGDDDDDFWCMMNAYDCWCMRYGVWCDDDNDTWW